MKILMNVLMGVLLMLMGWLTMLAYVENITGWFGSCIAFDILLIAILVLSNHDYGKPTDPHPEHQMD